MARTPASAGRAGVGKSGSPAPRSITSSPAALRRFASCEMAIVAEVSRCCRLGEKPEAGLMGDRIATGSRATQPLPFRPPDRTIPQTSRPLTTEDRVTVADAKAALDRGRPVVLVRPPAVEQAAELWGLITPETPGLGPGVGLRVLIICADDASAAEWAAAAQAAAAPGWRAHAVAGLARARRLLTDRPMEILAGAVASLAALVERAVLKLDRVASVVVAWPETLVAPGHAARERHRRAPPTDLRGPLRDRSVLPSFRRGARCTRRTERDAAPHLGWR